MGAAGRESARGRQGGGAAEGSGADGSSRNTRRAERVAELGRMAQGMEMRPAYQDAVEREDGRLGKHARPRDMEHAG